MTEISDQEICRTCGKCCREFWWYEYNGDFASRFSLLRQAKVEMVSSNVWKIVLWTPCKALGLKNGRYSCRVYNQRPEMCRSYPANMPAEFRQMESEHCPLAKQLMEKA